MDAVQKFRYKRIKRLEERFGTFHGKTRFDADEEESNNGGNGGFHGNTRIPFGLCQREGIQIGKDWTPKDAWDALAGKGYSAGDVYSELKRTGKVAPKKKSTKTPAELKQLSKEISEIKKQDKLIKKLEKERATVEEKKKEASRRVQVSTNLIEYQKNSAQYYLDHYGSEENMTEDQLYEYNYHRNGQRNAEKKLEEAKADLEAAEKRQAEIDKQMAENNSPDRKQRYKQAVDELLENSPYTESVNKYRAIEEDSEEDRKLLKSLETEIETDKFLVESWGKRVERKTRELEEHTEDDYFRSSVGSALEAYKKLYEKSKASLEKHESMAAECRKRVEESDRKLADEKGSVVEKDWKQIHDLLDERDTVQNGPYTELESFDDTFKAYKVVYVNPKKYIKVPDEEHIITKVGGRDKTGGSCATLAFVYLANRAGYKILDFRGGKSQDLFARKCTGIIQKLGGVTVEEDDGFEAARKILDSVEDGKEYYFEAGRHATAIRKKDGKLEYLELQGHDNGWKNLTDEALTDRYSLKHSRSSFGHRLKVKVSMIESEKLCGSEEFISLLGYANTAYEKQKKGEGGGMK